MAEVRMVLGSKTYGILKPGYSHSFLDSVCTDGQSRAQDAMPGKASTLKERPVLAQGLYVSNQSPLLTTSQEHGTASNMSIYGNTCVKHYIWKPLKTCLKGVEICLDCKGNALGHDRPAMKSSYLRSQKLNGVNIWWTIECSGTIHPKVCRTRRDQIRTFSTLRSGTIGRGSVVTPLGRRWFNSNGSYDTPLYKTKSAYYEILEVAPTATQAQIKTAYYKQSFLYHPDKNAGSEEATLRFSEISEAYNVLGNKSLRKKYDRGILTHIDLQGARRPTAKEAGSSTGQQTRSRSSSIDGVNRQKVFDFDNFIKSHYGEQLQREREFRARQEHLQQKQKEGIQGKELGKMAEISVGILLAIAVALFASVKSTK